MTRFIQQLLEIDSNEFQGRAGRSLAKVKNAEQLKRGLMTVTLQGKEYTCSHEVAPKLIERGMRLAVFYDSTNHGVDFIEVTGVTVDVDQHENDPEFADVRDALRSHDCDTLSDAHEKQVDVRPVVKDLVHDSHGAWYYIYESSFVRGSGAEPLEFYKLVEAKV